MVHVLAIVGLAALCGVWVVIQQASGKTIKAGQCGACGSHDGEPEPDDGQCHGEGGPSCQNANAATLSSGERDQG